MDLTTLTHNFCHTMFAFYAQMDIIQGVRILTLLIIAHYAQYALSEV